MSDPICIEISGVPVPWTPARVMRSGHSFSPRYKEKKKAQTEVRRQYKGSFLEGGIWLDFMFEMPIPKSFSKRKKDIFLGRFHLSRPDCTNLIKQNEDCLVGIVFKDDNQVCRITAEKRYSESPKTTIRVHSI